MPDFEDWDSPSLNEDEKQYAMDVVKSGFRFLIFTCFMYTFIAWSLFNLLDGRGIISGNITWLQAGAISFGIIVVRMWDRVFFD